MKHIQQAILLALFLFNFVRADSPFEMCWVRCTVATINDGQTFCLAPGPQCYPVGTCPQSSFDCAKAFGINSSGSSSTNAWNDMQSCKDRIPAIVNGTRSIDCGGIILGLSDVTTTVATRTTQAIATTQVPITTTKSFGYRLVPLGLLSVLLMLI